MSRYLQPETDGVKVVVRKPKNRKKPVEFKVKFAVNLYPQARKRSRFWQIDSRSLSQLLGAAGVDPARFTPTGQHVKETMRKLLNLQHRFFRHLMTKTKQRRPGWEPLVLPASFKTNGWRIVFPFERSKPRDGHVVADPTNTDVPCACPERFDSAVSGLFTHEAAANYPAHEAVYPVDPGKCCNVLSCSSCMFVPHC